MKDWAFMFQPMKDWVLGFGYQWKIGLWLFWLPMKDRALVSRKGLTSWHSEFDGVMLERKPWTLLVSQIWSIAGKLCIFSWENSNFGLNGPWQSTNDFMSSCIKHITRDCWSPFRRFKIKKIYHSFQMLLLFPKVLVQYL